MMPRRPSTRGSAGARLAVRQAFEHDVDSPTSTRGRTLEESAPLEPAR